MQVNTDPESVVEEKPDPRPPQSKPAAKKPQKLKPAPRAKKAAQVTHPWICAKLKGHTDEVTAIKFSPTGKETKPILTQSGKRTFWDGLAHLQNLLSGDR